MRYWVIISCIVSLTFLKTAFTMFRTRAIHQKCSETNLGSATRTAQNKQVRYLSRQNLLELNDPTEQTTFMKRLVRRQADGVTLGFKINMDTTSSVNGIAKAIRHIDSNFIDMTSDPIQNYPVYRFYSPVARAYLNDGEQSQIAMANTRDPLGSDVEWEWITLTAYSAAYIRNKKTKRYLCFNGNGRPTLLKKAYIPRCLFRVYALIKTPKQFSHSVHNRSPDVRRLLSTMNIQNAEKSDENYFPESSVTQRHLLQYANENLNSSESTDKDMQTSTVRTRRQTASLSDLQLVWFSTAAHWPVWRIRFCPNGMPFAHHRPMHGRCRQPQLNRLSDIFIACPQVPVRCKLACTLTFHRSSNEKSSKLRCDKNCSKLVYCSNAPGVNFINFDNTKLMHGE
ncbi:hypothetical protein PHET_04918 [Paragonimus heterotremus]|uniref:Uncharacterized protein n=1 Tax=Paragonimus heterotremus TaxID=100268 RepID=A0A8J4SML8_9TREM|nr:hypothetical protein PHET_04918 [Paragonimus heterotremus]